METYSPESCRSPRFEPSHRCSATVSTTDVCPGYVVDDIVPFKRGGPAESSNMQWQTTEEARPKDRVE